MVAEMVWYAKLGFYNNIICIFKSLCYPTELKMSFQCNFYKEAITLEESNDVEQKEP